jgi:hypothetical protein
MTTKRQVPAPLIAALLNALRGGNGVMTKRFLESRGVARGANDNIEQLADRVEKYFVSGRLTEVDLRDLLRELLEYGAKRVHLMLADQKRLRAVRASMFGDALIQSLDEGRVAARPAAPRFNYALVESGRLRFCYSETHQWVTLDRKTRRALTVSGTRVIVIEADTTTGLVTIALDSPGTENPHGPTASSYFDHYIGTIAPQMLGTTPVPLELYGQLRTMLADSYRALVRPAVLGAQDSIGVRVQLAGSAHADLRDSPSFQLQQGEIRLPERIRFTWLSEGEDTTLPAVRAGTTLIRDVTTDIFASPAVVRFEKHTLSHEFAYVIRQIRQIA